jgi:hypothetical protein
MPRKLQLEVKVEIRCLPMPPGHAAARRAALLLLARWVLEDLALHPEENDQEGLLFDDRILQEAVSEKA